MSESTVPTAVVDGLRDLGVCLICDVLDHQLGIRAVLSPEIKPLARVRIAGRAVTLLEEPQPEAPPSAIAGFFEAADRCGPGSILVASMSGDRTLSITGDLVVAALHAPRLRWRGAGWRGARHRGDARAGVRRLRGGGQPARQDGQSPHHRRQRPAHLWRACVSRQAMSWLPIGMASWSCRRGSQPTCWRGGRAAAATEVRVLEAIQAQARDRPLAEIFAQFE